MAGKWVLNQISTTLPRMLAIFPVFDSKELIILATAFSGYHLVPGVSF
jgi:hypothetical protein